MPRFLTHHPNRRPLFSRSCRLERKNTQSVWPESGKRRVLRSSSGTVSQKLSYVTGARRKASRKKEKHCENQHSDNSAVLTVPVYPSLWGIPVILLILGVLWIFLTDRYTEFRDIFVLKFPVWLEEIEVLFQQENWLALCGKILIPLMTGILVTLFWLFWMLVLAGLLWIFVFSFLSWWRTPEKWILRLSRRDDTKIPICENFKWT